MPKNDNRRPVILIVDDVPENLDVLKGVLDSEYTVRLATNGHVALKAANVLPYPDLILLDIMMPEIDGFEVCRRLKANMNTSSIPIIFVTAKSDETDEIEGLALGAVDYITKPFSIPRIQARIKTHLTIFSQKKLLEQQKLELIEAAKLREDIDHITQHDLKGPLGNIIGFASLINNQQFKPEQLPEFIKIIESSAYRLLNMINTSLDIYQIEAGCYKFKPKEVDLLKVIGQIEEEYQPMMKSKKMSLIIQSPTDLSPVIQGEDLLCLSLFSNLIKNGIEASPVGYPININFSKAEPMIQVKIHNSGAVPEKIRDNFFEKFITSGKRSGTGLGTYSAQLITKLHQGMIYMETSESTGTSITVQFPSIMDDSVDGKL